MEKFDNLLDELKKFEESGNEDDIPADLDTYLKHVAKTGNIVFSWQKVKHLIRSKLSLTMADFYDYYGNEEMYDSPNVPSFSYTSSRDKILQHLDGLSHAPFTIQRLCEILMNPTKHYKSTNKFVRALEKNVYVVSAGRTPQEIMDEMEESAKVVLKKLNIPFGDEPATESVEYTRINGSTTENGVEDESPNKSPNEEDIDISPSPKRRKLNTGEASPVPSPDSEPPKEGSPDAPEETHEELETPCPTQEGDAEDESQPGEPTKEVSQESPEESETPLPTGEESPSETIPDPIEADSETTSKEDDTPSEELPKPSEEEEIPPPKSPEESPKPPDDATMTSSKDETSSTDSDPDMEEAPSSPS